VALKQLFAMERVYSCQGIACRLRIAMNGSRTEIRKVERPGFPGRREVAQKGADRGKKTLGRLGEVPLPVVNSGFVHAYGCGHVPLEQTALYPFQANVIA
jgi:hypothetical protein